MGDWKLVSAGNAPWELYNLSGDRAEQHNLAEERPEKVKSLAKAWQKRTDDISEVVRKSKRNLFDNVRVGPPSGDGIAPPPTPSP